LSRVLSVEPNTDPIHFEFLGESHQPGALYEYKLQLDERSAEYEGRLVIDCGPGSRSWCQRAHLQDNPIIEIRRTVLDVEWPGFMNLLITEHEVIGLAPNWQVNLSAANGVYLLTCAETAGQYVGAAFGAEGFLGRWRQYAADSHGGNKLLKERSKRTSAPLNISILDVFGSTTNEEEAYAAESRWKLALGSRAHGLNGN